MTNSLQTITLTLDEIKKFAEEKLFPKDASNVVRQILLELVKAQEQSPQDNEIRFWDPASPYACFSNFTFCNPKIELDGWEYPSVEHAYQAAKTLNIHERSVIFNEVKPNLAKKLGKTVTLRDDWEEVKVGIMYDLVRYKFSMNDSFRKILIESGNKTIVENSPYDKYWGSGSLSKGGTGKNMLGKILMLVREELR